MCGIQSARTVRAREKFFFRPERREKSFRLSEYVTSLRQLRDNYKMKFRRHATSRTRDCNYSIFATVTKFRRGETRGFACGVWEKKK